jgi:fatty-acyl-CoA synthase
MASRYPHRPAFSFEGREATFRAADAQVDEVARSLLALGVRRGDRVAVLCGNRPEWLLVAFGAARIGATLAPLNTWYLADELRYQLAHSEASVLFTVDRLRNHNYAERLTTFIPELDRPAPAAAADGLPAISSPAVPHLRHVVQIAGSPLRGAASWAAFLRLGDRVSPRELAAAEAAVRPDDIMYILYTSGSTAAPKAVMLHHGDAIVNDFEIGERQHVDFNDRIWVVTPMFYAFAAVNSIPNAWSHGACLVLQETFSAEESLEVVQRERATVYYGQPHITRALLDHPGFRDYDLSSLQKGVVGRTVDERRLTMVDLGVTRCCSMYGLTEVYGHCAVTDADDPLAVKLETQGRPLPDWTFKVVEPGTTRELPAGEAGELRVRGRLFSGYYKAPELTAASFDEDGFYLTGDLVTMRPDGRMVFQSRLKEIIKVGGINVAPVEIEDLLSSHPDIAQAHVIGLPDRDRGEVVAAFVEPNGSDLTEEDVRSFVRERASRFKVPSHVFFRTEEQLPRLQTGKVPKPRLVEEALRELGADANTEGAN